jgi:hypothetical protein
LLRLWLRARVNASAGLQGGLRPDLAIWRRHAAMPSISNRCLKSGKRGSDPEAVEDTADAGTVQADPETPAAVESRTLQMLGSLGRAA